MNFLQFPSKRTKLENYPHESLVYYIEKIVAEFEPHYLVLDIVDEILDPAQDNFTVLCYPDKYTRGDPVPCQSFKRIGELDKNVGHLIRTHGKGRNSQSYIDDNFMPFFDVLAERDAKFRRILKKENDLFMKQLQNTRYQAQYNLIVSSHLNTPLLDEIYKALDRENSTLSRLMKNKKSSSLKHTINMTIAASEHLYKRFFKEACKILLHNVPD